MMKNPQQFLNDCIAAYLAYEANFCRAAYRQRHAPDYKVRNHGFRVCFTALDSEDGLTRRGGDAEGGEVVMCEEKIEDAARPESASYQGFTYAVSPASFGQPGQKVRLPDEIIQYKTGCCLDTTLLFAAVMSHKGCQYAEKKFEENWPKVKKGAKDAYDAAAKKTGEWYDKTKDKAVASYNELKDKVKDRQKPAETNSCVTAK